MDFNHVCIAFDLVVVKGDAKVIHENKNAGGSDLRPPMAADRPFPIRTDRIQM